MQKELLESIKGSLEDARFWVEVCYDDDCPAFKDHATSILRLTIRDIHLAQFQIPSHIMGSIVHAYGALVSGDLRAADSALHTAIQYLQIEIAKEGERHDDKEDAVRAGTDAPRGTV